MPRIYTPIRLACPHCGSDRFHMRKGFHLFARFRCHKCKGTFFRARQMRQKPFKFSQLTDSATIMKKCAEHFARFYDELEDRDKSHKHEETIFDNILSRCTGEAQEKVEYVIKCLPNIHTAILVSISKLIAKNNWDLLKLFNNSLPHEHELK